MSLSPLIPKSFAWLIHNFEFILLECFDLLKCQSTIYYKFILYAYLQSHFSFIVSFNFSFIASCHQYFQTSHLQLASSITNNSCLILVSLNLLSSGSLLFLSINLFFGTGPCNYIIILYFGLIHFYFELMNQVKLVFQFERPNEPNELLSSNQVKCLEFNE